MRRAGKFRAHVPKLPFCASRTDVEEELARLPAAVSAGFAVFGTGFSCQWQQLGFGFIGFVSGSGSLVVCKLFRAGLVAL